MIVLDKFYTISCPSPRAKCSMFDAYPPPLPLFQPPTTPHNILVPVGRAGIEGGGGGTTIFQIGISEKQQLQGIPLPILFLNQMRQLCAAASAAGVCPPQRATPILSSWHTERLAAPCPSPRSGPLRGAHWTPAPPALRPIPSTPQRTRRGCVRGSAIWGALPRHPTPRWVYQHPFVNTLPPPLVLTYMCPHLHWTLARVSYQMCGLRICQQDERSKSFGKPMAPYEVRPPLHYLLVRKARLPSETSQGTPLPSVTHRR